jgi:hypothetical protein
VAATSLPRLALSLSRALVLGCIVRLYLEPSEKLPAHMRPQSFVPVIDCNPDQARELKRRLTRQGYHVIAVPL